MPFFFNNWQRKIFAILAAFFIWLFVNGTIIDTKNLTNIPVRIVSLPSGQTIVGLQPNGLLAKRITLTLTGSKGVIDELEPGDVEVIVDASTLTNDISVVNLTKKNLRSLNPSFDLANDISQVNHNEFTLKLSPLIFGEVPLTILPPKGQPPQGYIYLDYWPQKLVQKVSGPEELVQKLVSEGLEVQFDLGTISKAELDKIKSSRNNYHDDEVSFFIPNTWKKVAVPFRNNALEDLNDADAQNLHIDFLRKETMPLGIHPPIRIFYPLKTGQMLNPDTLPLKINPPLKSENHLFLLDLPLYAKDVSKLFLETIRDNIEIVLIAQPFLDGQNLNWSVNIVDPEGLEKKYISALTSNSSSKTDEPIHTKWRVIHLQKRFRSYLNNLKLYTSPETPLKIDARIENSFILVNVPNAL